MALHITDWMITSDITPETAHYIPLATGGQWILSWLPGRALTREQAVSGMVLDEILSTPDPADGEFALELAGMRAAQLGIVLEDVVLRLAARMLERDGQHREPRSHRRTERHTRRPVPEGAALQRLWMASLSVSAVLTRTLYAVATIPSLCFVGMALLMSRVTDNAWAVLTATLATSTLACTLTITQAS